MPQAQQNPEIESPWPLSVPASEYDSEPDFVTDAEARDVEAGILHDAVQQAVMQCG